MIDILPGNVIEIQDPAFEYWLKNCYQNPVKRVTNALSGQVAGVQTTSSSGQPGKDAEVRIRGIGSISASNKPLYVVDGVPYDGEISAISTSDIESMTVLKDAASNALYGARGANGVILITTKKGKSGDVLAGHENYNYKIQYLYGQREKLYNPNIPELNNGISNQYNASYSKEYATEGWLFRIQYDYDGKYFGSASFRRDASSCFHPDNRWGNFWSIGAGWLMNKESFLENQSWINILKFKISYGLQGNDNLMYEGGLFRNYYPYQDQFTLANSNGDFSTSLFYKGNKDITWETYC